MVDTTRERVHTDSISFETQLPEPRSQGVDAPDPRTADWLWIGLVGGLLAILAIAVVGLIVAAERNAPRTDDLLAPVTAILSGLLALFVHPPTRHGHPDR